LEHRHGRSHALNAGNVAGGRNDAAPAATDNDGFVAQRRIVALLDRGIECVTVEMRYGQGVELGMTRDTRTAAGRTASSLTCQESEAVAAETRPLCGCGHVEEYHVPNRLRSA